MLQERSRLLRSKRSMAASCSAIFLVVALSVFPPIIGAAQSTQCEFNVVENTGAGYFVGQPLSNVTTTFNFIDSSTRNCSRFFTVDSSSVIRTRGNLDREEVFRSEGSDQLNCILQFRDPSTSSERQLLIAIQVLDINDETPSFFNLEPVHVINILESIGVPNPILSLQPVDNDKGPNGTVVFNITHGNELNYFRIERPIGDYDPTSTMQLLTVVKSLDFEKERQFNLTVTISDMGSPVKRSFNQTLVINVTDSNDERPVFITSSYQFAVPEDHPLDRSIGNTTANDPDSKGAILYTIYSNPNMSSVTRPFVYEYIRVDVATGDIYLTQHIDFDRDSGELKDFTFYVQAQNPGRNAVTIARVQVETLDVNDEPPYFHCIDFCPPSTQGNLTVFVEENDLHLPHSLPTFEIMDDDSSEEFSAVSKNVSDEFLPAISATSKTSQFFNSFLVTTQINQTLDRETTPNVTLFLTVYNTAQPPLSGTKTIFIIVTDKNDNAPQFLQNIFRSRISESFPTGKEILTITAWDEDEGENGTLSFAITGVDKPQAQGWFAINQSSGRVSVNTTALSYNLIDGQVTLTVTATDHGSPPLSNTTTVEITLSPAITFAQRSYQRYSGYNILEGERERVYLEFRTTQTEGLLLYQAGAPGKSFTLKVEGGKVQYQLESGGRVLEGTRDTASVSNDRWHSVEVVRRQEEIVLSVWVTDQHAPSRLENSTLAECRRTLPQTTNGPSLYVGGVDLFALPSNATLYMDFVGSIRNVIIGSTQLDLECPSQEENAILGFHRSNSCENVSLSCTGAHTTGCVDYAPQPYCSCLGGFDPQACQQENSYAPIKFQGDAKAEISLGYSFFYDLATVDTSTGAGPQQRRRRRRRRSVGGEEVLQTVEISFRPVEVRRGILLYSRTQTSIHVLKIEQADENQQTIIYNVFDPESNMAIVNVPLGVQLAARGLYTATITITSSTVTLSLQANGTQAVPPRSESWGNHPVTPFAQQPQTLISIGGGSDSNPMAPVNNEHFSGCISLVSINHIELPLSGLLNTSTAGGVNTVGNIEASCDLCNPTLCPADMQCVSDQSGSYECQCPAGWVATHTTGDQERCALPMITTPPSSTNGLGTPSDNGFPFYYIIASCVGGLIVVGVCVLAFVLLAKCGYSKYERKKRTYHFGREAPNNAANNVPTLKPNFYTTVLPRNSDSETSNQDRSTASMSTYHEHDIPDDMVDTETNKSFSRRRSTISAESGIKTDTDRDDRSTGGFPRMEDSGNEKDTDYSPPESESDDVLSSCMETVLSPSGVNLVGSTSSVMGIPIHVSPCQVPLTPKERKALTPLRPDSSAILSMSEMDEETDMEAYKRARWPPRAVGNRGTNSDSTSKASPSESGTPKWYKSSTASDTEREKMRALRTRPYYPPLVDTPYARSPPTKASPPAAPHGYKSPPVFMHRSYSSQRPYQQSIDSPLSQSYKQISSSGPHSPHSVQLQQTPELLSKSQPNRFCYPSSAVPHRQLNSPPSSIGPHRQLSSPASSPRHPNSPPSTTLSHHSPQAHPTYMLTSTSVPYHSCGGETPTNHPQEQHFQDLKSVATINPISYWEMQDRMKSTVDQVDVFSEPYIQFEDVSTNPSILESQMTFGDSDRPEHQVFCSEGGGEGAADLLELSLMQPDDDTLVTSCSGSGPPIKHFPSADCSEEYTRTNSVVTLIASRGNSNSSPKRLSSGLSNGFIVPSSQEPLDV